MSLDFLKDIPEFQDLVRALAKRIVYIQPADFSMTRFEEACAFFNALESL